MKTKWLYLALVVGTISLNVEAGKDLNFKQIRELVKQGKILSLETILQKYPQDMAGKLLDLELEGEHHKVVYELKFLRQNGEVVEFKVDASTGEILEEEVKD